MKSHPTFEYRTTFLGSTEAKKLIGKKVAYISSEDKTRGQYFLAFGRIEEARGKNVKFDTGEWRSLSQLPGLQEV